MKKANPKSRIFYYSIYVTFLKGQNFAKGEQMTGCQGFRNGVGNEREVREENFAEIQLLSIIRWDARVLQNVHHWRKKWAKYTQYLSLYIFYLNCVWIYDQLNKNSSWKIWGIFWSKKNNYCYKKEGFLDDILVDTNSFLSLHEAIAQVELTSFFPGLGAAAGLWSIWPSLGGSQRLHFPMEPSR